MTIIVTGGAGFIGSNFIFYMLKKHADYRIVCLDKLTYAGNLSTLASIADNPSFRFVKADICDKQAVEKLFEEEKPDIIVNFAAESHVDRSIEDPGIFLKTNILGTQTLMDACRKYGIKRYHQVSTDEVYGDLPLDRPDLFFTEETPIHTSSPYSASKASADLLVLAYHRTYGLPVTISRCSNNYGPYHFPEKLIPLMIANALNDKPLPVYGKGENGDLLIQKAPACTIETQAQAVTELFGGNKEDIRIIGIRHGEKMYETLLTNEECAKAVDMGEFYRVPADNRGLNYDKYFKEGDEKRNTLTEFNSNNTRRLNLAETKEKIASLEYIKEELASIEK